MKAVIDTNGQMAGLQWRGASHVPLGHVRAGAVSLLSSPTLLAELVDVLSPSKFAARLRQAVLTPQSIVDDLRWLAVVVSPTDVPRVVPTDPDDDHVIAAAVTGQADLIASGDKRDLLPPDSFQRIPIITAREAVERLEARGKT